VKKVLRKFLIKVMVGLLACITSATSYSQATGCKDPLANNYNASATINDGSCMYNVTNYNPAVKVNQLNAILNESSGLQMAGSYLWSFNDGGSSAAIYRIDTLTNTILQTVNLGGATDVDWEDIAFDGTHFYIGDFGNNFNGARMDLKIYKFPFSAIPDYVANPVVTIPANEIQEIKFRYNDQVQPPVEGGNNATKFDCEAMIVDNGIIHLFSKNWVDQTSTHYILDNITAGINIAMPVETLATGYLVTGADKAVDRETVVLLGYQNSGFGSHFLHLLTDYSNGKYFNGNKRKIGLPSALEMGQAEGITFRNSTYGYISNEKFLTLNAKLKSFDIGNFVSNAGAVLAINFASFKALQTNNGIRVEWAVSTNKNISHFTVEKSTNGREFMKAGNVTARANINGYNWLDANPAKGNNFYRIRAIEKSGTEKISTVIVVKVANNKSAIRVFTNPVNGRSIQLELANQEQGNYLVQLYNNNGQQLSSVTINHIAGSATEIIPLSAGIVKGVYQLKVSNGHTKTIQQIIVD
jgi:hypothetical protein